MLTTTVLLTEDRLARDFLAALERRELPEKYFYWFPTSVRAWLNLCGDGAYRNYVRSHTLLQEHLADVVAQLPAGEATVISLGAGQGTKDLLVLEQLRVSGREPRYFPVDASQSLLEMACAAALEARVPCVGFKADMADSAHLVSVRNLTLRGPPARHDAGQHPGSVRPCGDGPAAGTPARSTRPPAGGRRNLQRRDHAGGL